MLKYFCGSSEPRKLNAKCLSRTNISCICFHGLSQHTKVFCTKFYTQISDMKLFQSTVLSILLFSGAAILSNHSFGLSGAQSTFQYFSCSSTATEISLSQCNFSGSCYVGTCKTEYGIRCYGMLVQFEFPMKYYVKVLLNMYNNNHILLCMCVCVQNLRVV